MKKIIIVKIYFILILLSGIGCNKEDKSIKEETFEWVEQIKTKPVNGNITSAEILAGVKGATEKGYSLKKVEIINDNNTKAKVQGTNIVGYVKSGTLTLDIVLGHSTKKDITLKNIKFTINFLTWKKQTVEYSNVKEIGSDILLGMIVGKDKGDYVIKGLFINDAGGTGAEVIMSGESFESITYKNIGDIIFVMELEDRNTKKKIVMRNISLRIGKEKAPLLSWVKQVKEYSSEGEITGDEILAGVRGNKTGYRIKTITLMNKGNTTTRILKTSTSFIIDRYKIGTLIFKIILTHDTKKDLTLTGAQFEITKGGAESLTWTKQTKPFSSGREITNTELLAGVTGSGKNGYTIKTVTISNDGGTGATVSGSGTSAKITSYNKAGTLTLTIVLQHDGKKDTTLQNAQFKIIEIFHIVGDNTITIKKSVETKKLKTIIIPDKINNIIIRNITKFAFKDFTSLTNVKFPNSLKSIGGHAFEGCISLTSIIIPDNVTNISKSDGFYGEAKSTFKGCISLTSVTIGNSVKSIGWRVFEGCTALTSITIPNSVTSIGNEAFKDCHSLTSITIPNSVTSIGNEAFKDCHSLTSITIPNSVTYIGSKVFKGCSQLTTIRVPKAKVSAWSDKLKHGNRASVVGY